MLVVFLAAPVTLIRWQRSAEAHPSYLPQQRGPAMQHSKLGPSTTHHYTGAT
jgi:hypothetical protein